MMEARTLIETVIKALVDDEGAVAVNEVHGMGTTIFEVSVHKKDFGKVIGRQGAHIQAIQLLLEATAKKLQRRYSLDLIEPA